MTNDAPSNLELYRRIRDELPWLGFSWEIVENNGNGPVVEFNNYPTTGASLEPLQVGQDISLEKMEEHLDSIARGDGPVVKIDPPERQRAVQHLAELRRRQRRHARRDNPRRMRRGLW